MKIFRKIFVKLFFFKIEYLYLLKLRDLLLFKPKKHIQYRKGTQKDLENLPLLLMDYNEEALDYSSRRLKAGDCMVVGDIDGELVFYCWLSFGEYQLNMDNFLQAPTNMACVYKVFVHPNYRGNQFYPASYNFIKPLLEERKISKLVSSARDTNLSSLRSMEKVGFKTNGKIYSISLFGKRYFYINAKAKSLFK